MPSNNLQNLIRRYAFACECDDQYMVTGYRNQILVLLQRMREQGSASAASLRLRIPLLAPAPAPGPGPGPGPGPQSPRGPPPGYAILQGAPVQAAPVQAVPVQAVPVQAAPVQAVPVPVRNRRQYVPKCKVIKKALLETVLECVICQEEKPKKNLVETTCCSNQYCEDCLKRWVDSKDNRSCPTCRVKDTKWTTFRARRSNRVIVIN